MPENRLRTLLRDGKPTFGTRLQSSWPTLTEIVGRSKNFDYVEFLAEYAPYDLYALDNLARAIELYPNFTGLIKMERSAQAHLAVRAMAAGIQNLLFTDVRTAADAEECVRIAKPEVPGSPGTHGNDAGRAAIGGATELIKRYAESVIVLMIEKKAAVENLESILQVKGVDMVQFGPSDYGISIGLAGQREHPTVVEAREHTIRTAIKMGVRPRAEIGSPQEAEYYLNLGVKDFNLSTDTAILAAFYRDQGAKLREVVGQVLTGLPSRAAVLIVGGGVMGASIAYHLAARGQRDIVLLERSELFGQGATGKCAGGVRHQFASEINIRLSSASIRMLEAFETEPGHPIGLRQCGYLFMLTRAEDVDAFRQNVALQHRLGVMTEWLTPDEVRRRVPQIRADDVLGGTFYGRDGIADPSGVVDGYVTGARRAGVTLLTGVEVTGLSLSSNGVRSVHTNLGSIEVTTLVNAAGPFAAKVGRMHGAELPITPLRRQMLLTTPLPEIPSDFPFVIDFATGLYFHREGTGLLTGMANRDEPPGFDEGVDLEWERTALEFAVRRMPLLADAGLARHWAGLYEMTPDAHPLVGRLAPFDNVFVAAGFSGHGFMQGPIIGKLMAELMLDGHASTIDISALSPARFATGATVREYNVV